MSKYIAVIDYEHLENAVFLTSFAKSLAKHGNRKGIIIHGDSEYTERLIQTGMMRKDARERAIKDLNRRLIALFADNGVSAVGVSAFQKNLVAAKDGTYEINLEELNKLPDIPCLLISSLAEGEDGKTPIPLPEMATLFQQTLNGYEVVLFSKNEKGEFIFDEKDQELRWEDSEQVKESVPDEFNDYNRPAVLTSSADFSNWPDLKNSARIK